MTELESRKAALVLERDHVSDDAPVLMHPGLADVYRRKVSELTEVLHDPFSQAEAATLIRSLLTTIRLVPAQGRVLLELVVELVGRLALGVQNDKSRAGGAAGVSSTVMVAGAGFEPAAFRL